MNEFNFIIDKIMERLNISTVTKLRSYLFTRRINKNTFDGWKKRGRIPANGMIQLSRISGIPLAGLEKGLKIASFPQGQNLFTEADNMKAMRVSAENILKEVQRIIDKMDEIESRESRPQKDGKEGEG